MIKKMLSFTLIVLSLSTLTVTNWSCEKIFGGDSVEENITLSQDKTEVTPFEIVTITAADYTFSNDVYYATIADKDIELSKATDNQLMFMMPYITSGNHKLIFTIDDIEYNIEFDINSPEPINNPEEVIDSYKQNVVVAFDTLKYMNQIYNLQIESQNLQVIENYLTDFDQAYASATEDEKQELAQFMQANPDLFDFSNFDYSFFNDSLNTSKNFIKWDQKLTRDMQYYTGLVIATGVTVVLFNGALISLNPLAIFITGGALLTEVYLLKSQTKTILNRSYKPFEFDISNELRSQTVGFDNDVEYILGIDGTYRTLYNNDQGSSNVIIELVANINTFTGYWNKVLENIPGVSGSVTNLNAQNSYIINVNESSVTPQYISIENISNSNVTLSQFSNTDAARVTFTTTSDEDQGFTFDIVYTNPDFSAETKQIAATLINDASTCTDPRDGQVYDLVKIGTQMWFAENLNYETANSWWYSDNIDFGNIVGRLYTWEAALTSCPNGWHLPNDDEWKILELYLGMSQSEVDKEGWRGTNEGKKLKSIGGWYSGGNGTDAVGFTGLAAGIRTSDGGWTGYWGFSRWWSATEYNSTDAWFRELNEYYNSVGRDRGGSIVIKGMATVSGASKIDFLINTHSTS
ncbi:MAG: FISUMP domain-containing protein [Bacteroidota bacterium]